MNAENTPCLSDSDLVRFRNQDLSGPELTAFQKHLSSCPACSRRWEDYSKDADLVAETLRKPHPRSSAPIGPCLSDEQVAEYVGRVMSAKDTEAVERHLKGCRSCAAQVRSAQFFCWEAEHGGLIQESSVGPEKLLELVSRAGPSGSMRQALRAGQPGSPVLFTEPIRLACLASKVDAAQRLAAASGEGLSEQVFRQDQPPFEVHLVQFGQELHVTVQVGEVASPYTDCLAELRLLQDDRCVLTRIVLIREGLGRCVIDPSAIEQARPDRQAVKLAVQPLLTASQLAAAGTPAFVPILEQLLEQDNVEIQQAALKMLALIGGPQATDMLKRACGDASPSVRATAQKALRHLQTGD